MASFSLSIHAAPTLLRSRRVFFLPGFVFRWTVIRLVSCRLHVAFSPPPDRPGRCGPGPPWLAWPERVKQRYVHDPPPLETRNRFAGWASFHVLCSVLLHSRVPPLYPVRRSRVELLWLTGAEEPWPAIRPRLADNLLLPFDFASPGHLFCLRFPQIHPFPRKRLR